MYAVEYGLYAEPTRYGCDSSPDNAGFRVDHNVSVWVSNDLSSGSWEFVRHAYEVADRPSGILFRPDAILCPSSGRFVLWANIATPGVPGAIYAAATSDTPTGEFTVVQVGRLFVCCACACPTMSRLFRRSPSFPWRQRTALVVSATSTSFQPVARRTSSTLPTQRSTSPSSHQTASAQQGPTSARFPSPRLRPRWHLSVTERSTQCCRGVAAFASRVAGQWCTLRLPR